MSEKEREQKREHKKKIGAVTLSASVLAAGAIAFAASYRSGQGFIPQKFNRDLQTNQVVFSDNETTGRDKNKDNRESESLQKKQDANRQASLNNENLSKYLFESAAPVTDGNRQVITMTSGTGTEQGGSGSSDTVYDTSGNGSGDGNTTVIDGTNGGNGTAGDGNNNSGENGNGSNNNGGNNGNNGNNNGGSSDDPGPAPTPRPSDSAKEPEGEKSQPVKDPVFDNSGYVDGTKPDGETDENGDNDSVVIRKPFWSTDNLLYKGQSVTKRGIYNALDTYVKSGTTLYLWGASDFEKYVRIESVSLDGGKTWTSEFPVDIPKDTEADQFKIRVGYRLSESQTNWITREIDYLLEDSRILVLSHQITEENVTLTDDDILRNVYKENGERVNLYEMQRDYLGMGELSELFPGWTEGGKLLPWFYTSSEGRHILEPENMVKLEKGYTVRLTLQWLTEEQKVSQAEGKHLSYLQTLTNVEKKSKDLKIPEYIQAVVLDEDAGCNVDTLEIPDTVLYVDLDTAGLRVAQKYVVNGDNPNYAATEEGILTDKEVTEILGIPYAIKKITIPAGIKKAFFQKENQIQEITLPGDTLEDLPEINFEHLSNTKVLLKDKLLEDYLEKKQKAIEKGENLCVASIEDPKTTYIIDQGAIVSNRGEARKVLKTGSTTIRFSNGVRSVKEGAFAGDNGITTIVMPDNGQVVDLKEGSLKDSSVSLIRCSSKKQMEAVKKQLKASGASEDVRVELQQISKEGYTYTVRNDGENDVVTLVSVPTDLQEFDGTVTAVEDGVESPVRITEVADQAFANCTDLRWVTLPKSVNTIGNQAFLNCSALEGILIDARDCIEIGNEAFEGCNTLRFIASNAMKGIFDDGYDPEVMDEGRNSCFFIPIGAEGYGMNEITFVEGVDVSSYRLVSVGDGAKILYGVGAAGNEWLAIRAGKTMSEQISLPADTQEIFRYCMAKTTSDQGEYQINWGDLTQLQWIDPDSFAYSDLTGEQVFPQEGLYVDDYAFASCEKITTVRFAGYSIGLGMPIFMDCTNLERVELPESLGAGLFVGTFSGCDALKEIEFRSTWPPTLRYLGANSMKYQFNQDWDPDEEAKRLHIEVPEGSSANYISNWKYYFAGYKNDYAESDYEYMWDTIYWDKYMETYELPEDKDIDAEVEEKLLQAENRIRLLVGEETVLEPTDFYPYRNANGIYTLIGAPSYLTEVNLAWYEIGLPSFTPLDIIGQGAFSKCKNLSYVTIPELNYGIAPDAFKGVESDSLTLEFQTDTPPALLYASGGKSYSFGVEESKLHIIVPEGAEQDYIDAWVYAIAGYADEDELVQAVKASLTKAGDGQEPTEEEIQAEKEKWLLAAENRIRAMMGLKPKAETTEETGYAAEPAQSTQNGVSDSEHTSGQLEQNVSNGANETAGTSDGTTDVDSNDGQTNNGTNGTESSEDEEDADNPSEKKRTDQTIETQSNLPDRKGTKDEEGEVLRP